ncbi:hypothetical protein HHK36_002507 [Tetracentron sinense]|uniref:Uncharacterized protein n=1 Tax=Tetracentron sinense TaxID=13715 RepID=A0A834ZWK3_TETSI|nr:hypothetical protein HHK36_002507 [Tetracentron sinense]
MSLRFAFCILIISIQTLILSIAATALDASNDLPSKIDEPHQFSNILKTISVRQGWNLEQIRVSNLDVRNARIGSSQRCEFRLRIGKSDLVFKFSDEVDLWRRLKERGEFGSLVNEVSSKTVLNTFKLEGPFELRDFSLITVLIFGLLYAFGENGGVSGHIVANTTHTGLKRLLVGEGITIEVKGAQEVSLFHTSDFGIPFNRSTEINKGSSHFGSFRHSSCMRLLPVHISGSASLVAYRTRNPNTYIESTFLSQDTIELLANKCYSRHLYKRQACPMNILSTRLALLEKLLRGFLGDRIHQNGESGFLKAKITASTLVRFQLEVERAVGDNDTFWGTVAEWRTKPTVERVWFEVVARVEAGGLKPLVVKKVRPFIVADSAAWSNLMFNISFTKFPSILVPPEALTLDVKW